MLKDKIVKIRWVKNYASARNHIAVGLVKGETQHCLVVECRTFHFGKLVRDRSRVEHGDVSIRAVPWNRIEVVHVLEEDTDWKVDFMMDEENGDLILDNKQNTLIAKVKGRHLPAGEHCRQEI